LDNNGQEGDGHNDNNKINNNINIDDVIEKVPNDNNERAKKIQNIVIPNNSNNNTNTKTNIINEQNIISQNKKINLDERKVSDNNINNLNNPQIPKNQQQNPLNNVRIITKINNIIYIIYSYLVCN